MSEATEIIALDGPAGAGKSSTAKQVAKTLGFAFLDTGAMYRAATWRALHQGIDLEDPAALAESTRRMNLELWEDDHGQHVLVDGMDAGAAIRTPEVTRLIYKLDQNSAVRAHLVALQRRFGEQRSTVAEGRDIGTVVFPKAKCKVYLDASIECRAQRRAKQLREQGTAVDFDTLRREIRERDKQAMNRKDSPLRRAPDAVLLDTSDLTFEQVVDCIVRLARERL
jgi:cytidylate kinase